MKRFIKPIFQNQLVTGSAIIIIGSNLANIFSFLFSLFMGRNLSPVDFGILLSLVSLITLATSPAISIVPTIINFAATYYAKEEYDKVRGLFFKMGKLSLVIGVVLFILFLSFSSQINSFFHIDNTTFIILSGIAILFGYLASINTAFIQAKLSFTFIAFINFSAALLKFVFGVILVLIGYKVSGAMWAIVISFVTPYIVSFISLKPLLHKELKSTHTEIRELMKYGIPSAIALFSLASFINTDILLTKHFFLPKEAGYYGGLSLVGRIIFFLTASLSGVMFPLIVQKYTRGENYKNIFLLSILLVLVPSIFLTFLYFILPKFVILMTVKSDYLVNAKSLGYFAIFITIFSLLNIFTNFFLAIRKTNIYIPVTICAFLQAVLIWVYHKNQMEVITVSIATSSLLLLTYLLYYFHATRK